MFFAFDGIDGAGKTTQITRFVEWLVAQGHDVVTCRDPGSTPLGERVRGLLLDESQVPIGPECELLLYMAARAQLVEEIIAPALAAGRVVVSDRFLVSNVVYQGHARAGAARPVAEPEWIWSLGRRITRDILPELTFILDVGDDVAAARLARPLDRIEQRGSAFRDAVRAGFLAEARRDPQHIVLIDAGQSIDVVADAIRRAAAPLVAHRAPPRDGGRP